MSPFHKEGMDQMTLYRAIVEAPCPKPKGLSSTAVDLITKLLVKDPVERIGSWAGGELDILEHAWYKDLDLSAIRKRSVEAPWVPTIADPLDSSCFDDWDHLVDKMVEGSPTLLPSEDAQFADF